jgi:hypothetical protein
MPNIRKPRIKKNCDWCGKSFTMNTSEYHKKLKNKDGHFFHVNNCRTAWEKANKKKMGAESSAIQKASV